MAYSKDRLHDVGGSPVHPESVKGNSMAHNDVRVKSAYTAKIKMSHPTLRPQVNFKERGRSGTDVPKPPVLDLP